MAVLRQYAKKGAKWCAQRLPGRTEKAVVAKAADLGYRSGRWWSKKMLKTLCDVYPLEGPAGCEKRISGKTRRQITAMAIKLDLKAPKSSIKGRVFGVQTVADLKERCKITADGCWEYGGAKNSRGVGRVWLPLFGVVEDAPRAVHRLAGEEVKGLRPWTNCRTVGCCNPAHSEMLTPKAWGAKASEAGIYRTAATNAARMAAAAKRRALTPQQEEEIAGSSEPAKVLAQRFGVKRDRITECRARQRRHAVVAQASPFALGHAVARGLVSASC